jgi:hypothetical protein
VDSVEAKKVYVTKDGKAILVCPHCGTSKTVDVKRFKGSKDALKIRCTCQSEFAASLEFRAAYRKNTDLKGHYTKLPVSWGDMTVKNLSLTGVGFVTSGEHQLKEGDDVTLKITLDDAGGSVIRKKAVVRVVRDEYVGCEFEGPVEYDKALGFYLTS